MTNLTDQYATAKAPPPVKCPSSTVENLRVIPINGTDHAGVVTHRCSLRAEHADHCVCGCGHYWARFRSVR